MRRLFWFGLGLYVGVKLSHRGRHEWDAIKRDPLREVDRLLRVSTPVAKRVMRKVRTTIEV